MMLADAQAKVKYVVGSAGCGKTLTVNRLVSHLQTLPAQKPKYAGWRFVTVDAQYTLTLPQFCKLLVQVISCFSGSFSCA